MLAVGLAVLIHVDWHLGRHGHDHLSFAFPYHWLLGVLTFAPLALVVARRWFQTFAAASVFVIGLGVALGQGLELLGETLVWGTTQPFTNAVRWQVFGEFMIAAS